jgi:SAM-dependent methyltransferase
MSSDARTPTTGTQSDRTAAQYDSLPYPSLPVTCCHPSSLAAALSLFDVVPPRVLDGDILELGCASGGNIIPLAAQFPKARFVGVDISETHVKAAQKRIADLGLTNIEIRQADLGNVDFANRTFDFILCHGVFSWVPKPVQDAIFAICNRHLSPEGLAVISFNVLPGWHLRRVIRDICMMHAGVGGTPAERALRARQGILEIAKVSRSNDLYSTLLRSEAQRLAQMPLGYIMGEFLAETNLPCHFSEFYARARHAGLGYVCDAEMAASIPDNIAPAMADAIKALARGNPGALQQHIDLYTGRPFRRAVLVREGRQPQGIPELNAERLRDLHVAAELSPDRRPEAKENPAYLDGRGRKVTPADARANKLLAKLAAAFPSTLTFSELMRDEPASPEGEQAVLKTLISLIGRGQASAFTKALRVGRGETPQPLAWPVARLDAATPQPWISSQHHRAVRKIPALAVLLPMMDGSRSRADLQALLQAAIESGAIKAPARKNGAGANGSGQPALSASRELTVAIAYAARNGLLMA